MTVRLRRVAAAGLVLAVLAPAARAQEGLPPPETFARIYQPCAHCHQIGAGARTTSGPPLQGIVYRAAGAVPGYPYSKAMRESGLIWGPELLDSFIANPRAVLPGTRMVFHGISDPEQRAALVRFLADPKPD